MDTLTPAETARLLKVSQRTLSRWRSSYPVQGPAFVRVGASIRYPREGIVEFVEQALVMPANAHPA